MDGKINGSGGGGCMFAYVPNNPEAIAEAIKKWEENPMSCERTRGQL